MGKIGEGHMAAWFRQGLREARALLYPDSNVAQAPEYGLYGTRTPGEVAEARRTDEKQMDEEHAGPRGSVLDNRLREAESRSDRDDRDQDRGMDR